MLRWSADNFLWLFIALSTGSFQVHAQAGSSSLAGSADDYKSLWYLNNQYIQSWIRSDTATYNNLLWADDFVHQNSSDGLLYAKQRLLALFGKPRFGRIAYFFPEEIEIRFISPLAACIYARTRLKWKDEDMESLSRYNDVYVKRNNSWVCVAANVTPVAKPGDGAPFCREIPVNIPLRSFVNTVDADVLMLTKINRLHAMGFIEGKPELLDSILAADYMLQGAEGNLYDKKKVLEQVVKRRQFPALPYSVENVQVRFVAEDVAMIQAVAVIRQPDNRLNCIQYNDIYVKRENKWVCVSGNNTFVRN